MPEIESISQIKIGEQIFDIDAVTVGNKSVSEIGELVTSIDSSSTNSQYPSAKALYEMIYGIHRQQYLAFEALEDSKFKLTNTSNTLQYSTDNGNTWLII